MIRLEVAVAAPLHNTLTYLFEQEETKEQDCKSTEIHIGKRVLVPLGKRIVTGYVLDVLPEEDVNYVIKKIYEVLDENPLFHSNIVPFFRWVANYYHFPIGEVINTALPAGLKRSSTKVIRLSQEKKEKTVSNWPYDEVSQPEWYSALLQNKKLTATATKKILSNKNHKKILSRLVKDGVAYVDTEINKGGTNEKKEVCYMSSIELDIPQKLRDVNRSNLQSLADQIEIKTNHKLKFSEVKALYYHATLSNQNDGRRVPQKELLQHYKGASKPLKELNRLGLIDKITQRVYRNPFGETLKKFVPPKRLTDEQVGAVTKIEKSLKENEYSTYLLHGVTGSGKTEVYLKATEFCLKLGKEVLVLVPEIALATQLESHFVSRFGEEVVLLHSGLSRGEKFDQWSLAANGNAKIVIGARSAVFAPLKNLGLIVVDEEHDGGYKQDDSLRYNARDLAVLRGNFHNVTVVLGSATPSITSYYHANHGKYTLLSMNDRVGSSQLPKVEIIDLKIDQKTRKKSVFHEKFLRLLTTTLQNNEQSIVLLNRRGFSSSYLCQDCGEAVQCRHCNVTLTFHKKREVLVCHYCGYSLNSKIICSNCNSEKLIPFGFGTERIEEEIKEKFPKARIARLDSDTAADRKKFMNILKAMHNKEIDILIGTQMIAKGHHFPNVTFVGVVWADGGLNMPDYRSAERTFQLLSQVTGRAGRGEKKGKVLIQTMRPNHYAIELSRTHQYVKFYQTEINIRTRPAFPPFVRLVCLRTSGDIEFNVRKSSQAIVKACQSWSKENGNYVEVLGPASSPLEKLHDQYRWQILLKSANIRHLHTLCSNILENKRQFILGKTDITVDIDPENMM